MNIQTNYNWLKIIVLPIVLSLLSFVFVGVNVQRHTQISPMDEYVYIDYMVKIPNQGIVKTGEKTGAEARSYISCIGVANYGKFNEAACETGNFQDDSKYPYGGLTSADIYTPVYFAVSSVFAQLLQAIVDINFLQAARLSGALWLAAAMIFLYFALLKLQAKPLISFFSALALAGPATTWWTNTFVSTDASALFAGAVSFWGLVTYLQRGKGLWLPVVIAVVTTFLKFQNIIATIFVGIVILFATHLVKSEPEKNHSGFTNRRAILSSTAIVGSAIIAQIVWYALMKFMAVGLPPDQGVTGTFSLDTLSLESVNFLSGIAFSPGILPNSASIIVVISTGFTWLIVGASIAGTLSKNESSLIKYLSYSFLFVSTTSAIFLSLLLFSVAHIFISLPARYGFSLFPIGIAIVAITMGKNYFWRTIIIALSGIAFIISLLPVQAM